VLGMRFLPTSLPGVLLLEQERYQDERGFSFRTWCSRELAEQGLQAGLSRCSISFTTDGERG
jgi:dTDP-4-dehydrorhamnose 3,5-epimerase